MKLTHSIYNLVILVFITSFESSIGALPGGLRIHQARGLYAAEQERLRQEAAAVPRQYSIIIPPETREKAQQYIDALSSRSKQEGARLSPKLAQAGVLTPIALLGLLLDTKDPKRDAHTEVKGDGTDWNLDELGLLGDISVAVPVTIFDDGKHSNPAVHVQPFEGTLVYTPGALLANGQGKTPVDLPEVTNPGGNTLNDDGYYHLYERRLLPVFYYMNEDAREARKAIVTIPGLGCGVFAGSFQGQLGSKLAMVLYRFLTQHGADFPNIKAVYFDPYAEHQNERYEIHGISLMIRPLTKGNQNKPQLSRPVALQDPADDFRDTKLYSVVAWDHVSWPGNDFYIGSRATDDGVKAAATDSMFRLTGVQGHYNPSSFEYLPPAGYHIWRQVVQGNHLRLWKDELIWTPRN